MNLVNSFKTRSVLACAKAGLLLVMSAASCHAWAEASAFAYSDDGRWGWATRKTQKEANKVALEGCNQGAPKKDCVLDRTKAVARAEGGGRIGVGRSLTSLAEAKKRAIEQCGNPGCKVTFSLTKPGFFVVAKSEEDEKGDVDFYLAHQFADLDEAASGAVNGCQELTGQKCNLLMAGAIAGIYKVASNPAHRRLPAASEQNCRPNSPTVRCTSQCTNGNCIVSYENGCKIRVQTQARFDPFTNQWTYPAPSC
jgi:hypothetical protein